MQQVPKRNVNVYKKGQIVFNEGDVGEDMYIIRSGKVEVVKTIKDEEMILATLDPGSFFGEMALFGDKHRSATIRAMVNTELIAINKINLTSQLARAPDWFVAIMRTLVQRLKETNKRIKSPYVISMDYTLLKLLYWIISTKGESAEGKLSANFESVVSEIQSMLGVSKHEILEKLKDFNFAHLVEFSLNEHSITIPDQEKLLNFLLFLQGKEDKKTRMTSVFRELSNNAINMQYFERIYRLLARKKEEK